MIQQQRLHRTMFVGGVDVAWLHIVKLMDLDWYLKGLCAQFVADDGGGIVGGDGDGVAGVDDHQSPLPVKDMVRNVMTRTAVEHQQLLKRLMGHRSILPTHRMLFGRLLLF